MLGFDHGLAGPLIVRQCGDPGPAESAAPRDGLAVIWRTPPPWLKQAAAFYGSVWIGEWHTHSAAMPEPSSREIHSDPDRLADPQLAFPRIWRSSCWPASLPAGQAPVLHAWSFTGSENASCP